MDKVRILKYKFFLFPLVASMFLTVSCQIVRYVPVEHTEYVTVRDSVYFRDTLVRIELEKARLADFVDVGDTLVLSTDLARSTAFLDTTSGKLKGTLENIKKYVEKEVPLKEKIMYRDSIVYQDKPYPVEVEKVVKVVPKFWRIFGVLGILSLVAGVLLILRKLKVF